MNWIEALFLSDKARLAIRLYKSGQLYVSREWRELRYRALRRHGWRCQSCGRTPKKHGIVLHVDHRKPVSKYPHLALSLNNLQIGCEDCNIGKSNKYTDDWTK